MLILANTPELVHVQLMMNPISDFECFYEKRLFNNQLLKLLTPTNTCQWASCWFIFNRQQYTISVCSQLAHTSHDQHIHTSRHVWHHIDTVFHPPFINSFHVLLSKYDNVIKLSLVSKSCTSKESPAPVVSKYLAE